MYLHALLPKPLFCISSVVPLSDFWEQSNDIALPSAALCFVCVCACAFGCFWKNRFWHRLHIYTNTRLSILHWRKKKRRFQSLVELLASAASFQTGCVSGKGQRVSVPPMNDLSHCLYIYIDIYMSIASRSQWSSSSPSDPQSTVAVVYLWFRERFHRTQDDVSHRGVLLVCFFVFLKLLFTDYLIPHHI